MNGNDWISKAQWLKGVVEKPAGKAYSMISSFLPRSGDEPPETSTAIAALMGAVLWADGKLEEKEIEEFRNILARTHSPEMVEYFVHSLKNFKEVDIFKESAVIRHLPDPEKLKIVTALLKLSWVDNDYLSLRNGNSAPGGKLKQEGCGSITHGLSRGRPVACREIYASS